MGRIDTETFYTIGKFYTIIPDFKYPFVNNSGKTYTNSDEPGVNEYNQILVTTEDSVTIVMNITSVSQSDNSFTAQFSDKNIFVTRGARGPQGPQGPAYIHHLTFKDNNTPCARLKAITGYETPITLSEENLPKIILNGFVLDPNSDEQYSFSGLVVLSDRIYLLYIKNNRVMSNSISTQYLTVEDSVTNLLNN